MSRRGCLFFGLVLLASAAALAGPPSSALLPETTVGYIAAVDAPSFRAAWEQTQFGRLLDDPLMQPFVEDFQRQMEEKWEADHFDLGITWREVWELAQGEVCAALVYPTASKVPATVLLADVTGNREAAQALLDKMAASLKKQKAKESSVTLGGTRATLLAELGKGNQAAEEARKLFEGKEDKDSWLSLAQLYEKTKNWAEMGKALDAYEKLAASDEDRATLYFMRGAMHERMKNYDLAEAEFRKAMALDADNASLLNYFGYMLADRNVRLDEALKLITRALELDPGNGAFLDSLGWVYYRMDRLEEAETNLRRALEEVPRDATVRDHMGDVLARRGKLKEAIAEWQRAIQEWQAGPPSERDEAEIAKVVKKLEGAKVRLAQEAAGSNRRP